MDSQQFNFVSCAGRFQFFFYKVGSLMYNSSDTRYVTKKMTFHSETKDLSLCYTTQHTLHHEFNK